MTLTPYNSLDFKKKISDMNETEKMYLMLNLIEAKKEKNKFIRWIHNIQLLSESFIYFKEFMYNNNYLMAIYFYNRYEMKTYLLRPQINELNGNFINVTCPRLLKWWLNRYKLPKKLFWNYFERHIRNGRINLVRILLKTHKNEDFLIFRKSNNMNNNSTMDDIDINRKRFEYDVDIFKAAAQRGQLKCLKWLMRYGITKCCKNCIQIAFGNAAQNGHLHVIKWLHANFDIGNAADLQEYAYNRAKQMHQHKVCRWLENLPH